MKSGMVAADAVYDALQGAEAGVGGSCRPDTPRHAPLPPPAAAGTAEGAEVTAYQAGMEASWVWPELRAVRNYHPSFAWGLLPGMVYSGISAFLTRGREPWTLRHAAADSATTQPAAGFAPIAYPKPDGVLSFDLLTNLARSGTSHEADQPSHLRIKARRGGGGELPLLRLPSDPLARLLLLPPPPPVSPAAWHGGRAVGREPQGVRGARGPLLPRARVRVPRGPGEAPPACRLPDACESA